MKKILVWLMTHLKIRQVDLQAKDDAFSIDEHKPHPATEVRIEVKF